MQQKTFKYRLVPNMAQQDKLAQFAGSVRFVYNHGLALIKQALTSKSKLPFRYPQGFKYREKHVFLPKIGWLRYHNSRAIEGTVKQVTIKKEGNHWFIAVMCIIERTVQQVPIVAERAIGIDVGLMYFATTSEGKIIANPRFLKHDLAQLRRQQRRLSRKVKGSNNRKKQVQCVARLHQKIKNKRKDFTHKQSTIFVKNHDVIAVEDLHAALNPPAKSAHRVEISKRCHYHSEFLHAMPAA